jgi:hypothetical protein
LVGARGSILRRAPAVIAIAAVSGLLILTEAVIARQLNLPTALGLVVTVGKIFTSAFFFSMPVAVLISVIRRRWRSAISYFIAFCVAAGSVYGAAALDDHHDLQLTVPAHEAIVAFYQQQRSELSASVKGYRLVELQQRCHPLHSVECWIVFDPSHGSGVETEVGRWHRLSDYSLFPYDNFGLGSVDIRRIDADAYSVLTRSEPVWR